MPVLDYRGVVELCTIEIAPLLQSFPGESPAKPAMIWHKDDPKIDSGDISLGQNR